jgi:hypothetical protein
MAIKEKDLLRLIEINLSSSKKSKISFDGKNLLTRVPKEVAILLEIKKGQRIEWICDDNKSVKIKILK